MSARARSQRGGIGVRAPLTADRLKRLIRYSSSTGCFTWLITRGQTKKGDAAGAETKDGYLWIRIDGTSHSAGRLAWLYVHGEQPSLRVSFRDGNPRNRRFSNLRLSTRSQLIAHSKRRSDNKAGLKGVSLERTTGKWMANINKDGRRIYLGLFPTKDAAHAAYVKAARRLHGDFARAQ